ncbi:Asp-tRNA(Asn)/Glu-tRNA(Gln) amidotransferase subunit GatC [Halanaerobium salsuginis]|jgi:aspartyl-tRNA(Asn)/glutamyl-tRNA(Gln) amidotransferase subunit C|uniref:Aspartyl/glutamyl-tRNA(Asn/Gln) amidotransferase subunit C n=1 Tax=Halanaerobium salsuginis TaxID=29563 RepID=A0A1I4HB30_9FIRM|nr:Asp-tRNA(Asn)/Glu-tRNA(Gln) amidotransferase subunit GatC [Halanaerobium salsuginis]SFL38817.1 aspartyl/glutamyl-tRNA(Asn/Gln) amidotransferase subunit C [Halanaerobium salsuginis]
MIDKKDVEYAAGLAQLKLTESEKEKYTEQIGQILNYVDKLGELDTEGVVPTAYTVPMKNVLREDKVTESLPREKTLANAPDQKDGQFRTPKIMSD